MGDEVVKPTYEELETTNKDLRRDLLQAIITQEELRSTLRRTMRLITDAHDLLTPGMKAGVSEARALLQEAVNSSVRAANAE
jgi:ribosomal protein L17